MAHHTDPLISAAQKQILQRLCSIPTAPFVEQHVMDWVEQFVAIRKGLKLSRDQFGNLLIELAGAPAAAKADKSQPRWVFTAHMDHPGFVVRRSDDKGKIEADFRGGVDAKYFKNAVVRFFPTPDAKDETKAKITGYKTDRDGRPIFATLQGVKPIPAGTPGMWDQGPGRFKGGKFYSRVCDDLAGAAGALAMLDALHTRPPRVPLAVLLTRGEEVGFVGALAASIEPQLLRKTDRLIAIECSSVQPFAPQGAGAIVRVGDRTSVFNSSLSYFINELATKRAKRDSRFKVQRALMPGGTCEATVYDVYGFTAASICVALGNYHNMDKSTGKIGPEFIDINDWASMTALFIEIAKHAHEYEPGHALLKKRLEKRFAKWRRYLK